MINLIQELAYGLWTAITGFPERRRYRREVERLNALKARLRQEGHSEEEIADILLSQLAKERGAPSPGPGGHER